MKILAINVKNATQAKLILKPRIAIVKIPGSLPPEQRLEVRDKLMKVADLNRGNKQFLKLYYKIGTPYLFLNRKISAKKKETFKVYTYADL